MVGSLLQVGVLVYALVATVFALDPIEVKGNAFFVKGSSERFYMRGVDYQPGGSSKLSDPLADPDTCERDIKYFKDLGINTIRVYSIDNTADHDECMEKLADAGIYVILDVNIPDASISRSAAKCSYNTMYLEQVFASVLAMADYDNTLGFFAGNEVINDGDSTDAATYVKAVVRDIKTFIKKRKLRSIPVGYSAADVESIRLDTGHFFNCGDDELARVDMFGFNDYSWCGSSSYSVSGYDDKVKEFSDYSVPLFFSEFGCNKVRPRKFTEIESIYSTEMTKVFSGGLVYEYSEEGSNYGLVKISSDNKTVSTTDDYDNLKSELKKTKNPSGSGDYQSNLKYSKCPSISKSWNATSKLPSTPKQALRLFINGKRTPSGDGFKATTQWACTMENTFSHLSSDGGDDSSSSHKSKSSHSSGSSSSSSSSSKSSGTSDSKSSKKSDASSAAVDFKSIILMPILFACLGSMLI